jgi:hypothetical protein
MAGPTLLGDAQPVPTPPSTGGALPPSQETGQTSAYWHEVPSGSVQSEPAAGCV